MSCGVQTKTNIHPKAYVTYLKSHPSQNETLQSLHQEFCGANTPAGEVKKKVPKITKKAPKHDFVEPGKNKIKKTAKKLTKAEIAMQEEMEAMKKSEALGAIKKAESARARKKGYG